MKSISHFSKKRNTRVVFLFIVVFLIITCLYVGSKYSNKEMKDDSQLKENYVIIDKKEYDFEKFNLFLNGSRSVSKDLGFDCKDVRNIIYVGDGRKLNPSIFYIFPNAEYITICKCDIENIEIGSTLKILKELGLKKCVIKDVGIYSDSLKALTLDFSKIEDIDIRLPQLTSLVINYNIITEKLLSEFNGCKNVKRMSFIGSQLPNIEMLENFKNISCLRLQKTKTKGFDKLEMFTDLNEIYIDKSVDRSNIDFMYDNFKNGDIETKAYFSIKRHELN